MGRLELLEVTAELVGDLERGGEAFRRRRGAEVGDDLMLATEVAQQTVAYLERIGAPARWGGFLAVDPATRQVVGTCSYKGAPSAEGAVEIAYFTFPRHEGRGHGSAMAAQLLERAFAAGVCQVLAHTLPQPSASTRILDKLGFAFEGDVEDPEEGTIWRWRASSPGCGPSAR